MASIVYSNLTKTSVDITATADKAATSTRKWIFTMSNGQKATQTDKSKSVTQSFSELSPGTSYKCTVTYGATGTEYPSTPLTVSFTTPDNELIESSTVSLTLVSQTTSSLKIKASGMGSIGATRTFYWRLNGKNISTQTEVSGSTTSTEYEFTGLSADTVYEVEFRYKRTGTIYDTYYKKATFYPLDSGTFTVSSTDYGEVYACIDSFTERSYPRNVYFKCSSGDESQTGSVYYNPLYTTEDLEYTFKGLAGNKSYTVEVTSFAPNETTTYSETKSVYVKGYSTYDSAKYSYTVDVESVTLTLTNITRRDYNRRVIWSWKNNSTGNSGSKTTTLYSGETSASVDMTNLTFNTSYTFSISIETLTGTSTYKSGSFTVTTKDYTYTLSIQTFSTSSTVGVDITVSSAQTFDIPIKVYLDGARELTDTISAGSIYLKKTYITNINPATAYKLTVYDGKRQKTFTLPKRTKNNFKWSTNVASGEEFNLLATDWNEYTSQLKAKASYFGYDYYDPSSVSKGDTFTAVKFKGAATVINWLVENNKGDCKTKIDTSNIDKGKGIYASYILALATCLNE